MELALFGGTPIRDTMISYGRQWIDDDDIQSVVRVLKSPYLTQGPVLEQFEKAVANYVGAKYAVAFCNGTAALHGAYYAAGIGEGDEIITTPITFAATANAVLYLGAKPVFSDIHPQTYNIDVSKIEKAITPKTKAIVPVDFTGQPADLDPIMEIAKRYGLAVIEDGAHSLGATYKGRKIGSIADMTMFSFHPVKLVTTGEGGIIVTDSPVYYEKLKLFRSHGITKESHLLSKHEGPWYYEMIDLGYNYRMTDIQAALGLSQLQKLNQFIERRQLIANRYNEAFQEMKEIIVPHHLNCVTSSWHLYIIKLNVSALKVGRKEVFEALQAENIGVQVHYIPIYFHPYYQKSGYKRGICPIAEEWYENVITLPLFPKMTDEDIDSIIQGVKKVIQYYSIE
ncbi:UDP-4-amino-4,6-dideoxy-N-acetyl-beta-L-altrosamine transaminase [Anoxybacillus voinovskiensis]|uniref:UDP-4-amino-4, 6-dideoxy-N-acetyl-beta-L-altrosamine transaminase n=1 Tax=Anoxybacteroides voinovskiense TaxID=230470 RepID=A0A840DKC8_9BACL|nr:UDP-4-amino-4,6-dideoxy-N-acetyl-beta-L-altrosamine transaminase [Anoxybacillus voinovskiensis]MBB4073741.1 UDP-4-amino-4,6-dideoxy-N-acetyl-beta-L-altrosamine transaminase [Anoxybacillus voinovskiensis]GGJ64262.1 UDP-4-amino-4,6-dideoxy-N-acetyl-beta-L-altrosamine transaminase [Anoxybacillus voinovskiensis]